jgi:hypothetical protein
VCVYNHYISYFIIYGTIFLPFHIILFFTIVQDLKIRPMVMSFLLPFVKRFFYFIYIRTNAEQMSRECPMARVVRVALWLPLIWTLILNVYKPASSISGYFALFSMGVTVGVLLLYCHDLHLQKKSSGGEKAKKRRRWWWWKNRDALIEKSLEVHCTG